MSTTTYDGLINQAAAQYGVPASLEKGLLEQESGLNPYAIGPDSNGTVDLGIAQINAAGPGAAHPNVSPMQAFNPSYAIPWSARYLAQLHQACGSWTGALEKYNSGSCSGAPAYAAAVLARAGMPAAAASAGASGGAASGAKVAGLQLDTLGAIALGIALLLLVLGLVQVF